MKTLVVSGCLLSSLALGEQFKVYLSTEDIGGDSLKMGSSSNPLVIHIDKQSASPALIDTLSHSSNLIFADLPNVPEFVKASSNNVEHQMVGSNTWKHRDGKKDEGDDDKETEDDDDDDEKKDDHDKKGDEKSKGKDKHKEKPKAEPSSTAAKIPKPGKSTTLTTKTKGSDSDKPKATAKPDDDEDDEDESKDGKKKGKDKKKDKDDELDDELDDDKTKKEKGHKGKPVEKLPKDDDEPTIPDEEEKNYENAGVRLNNAQWLSGAALLGASVLALL